MKLFAALILWSVSAYAVADNNLPIELTPLPGQSSVTIGKDMSAYGRCGGADVAIVGIVEGPFTNADTFSAEPDTTDVRVKVQGKDHSYGYALSDMNIVRCVTTPKGPRLLVGSVCSGSSCTDALHYHIINPSNGSVFPREKATKDCDSDCVNKTLGGQFATD
ncbi:MAG: hypothetical protein PHU14_07870 [Methylovulum sp.]|nr:hypothetical protein [Methylovulum sp.]